MKPGYGLQLVQSQRLSLTPELRQAIMVLQMNALELTEFLRTQAEDNPLLEVQEESRDETLPDLSERADDEYYPQYQDLPYTASRPARDEGYSPAYERFIETRVSLRRHLLSQLGLIPLTQREYEAAEYVVGNIDDNGYLVLGEDEIALSSGLPVQLVSRVADIVRTLDPPGVGARSLKECLLIQAKAKALGPLALAVIERHLEDLGAGRYKKIANEERVRLKDVLSAREIVLSLDPKPGSQFSVDKPAYVVPDVLVERDGDQIRVRYNDKAVPSVRCNTYYIRLLESGDLDARSYLQDRLHRARSLMNSIEERRSTVLRVVSSMVAHQRRFFVEGHNQVCPLTMREIASELSIHESTVSRSVSNKYIGTPFGTFPCKMFFSPRVGSQEEDVSQYAVKKRIQELVLHEDPQKPLSDQDIAEVLSRSGVKIARRTVAKYRANLGIQPSNRRMKS